MSDPSAPTSPAPAYAALIAQSVISAGTFLIAKRALRELAPLEIAWFRFVLAGALFLALLAVLGKPIAPPPGSRLRVLLLGLLGLVINQGLFLVGLSHTVPTHAAIMYALTPVSVLVVARIALGERISRSRGFGVALAFMGVLVLLLARGLASEREPLLGDLLILGAMFAWTGYTVLARTFVQKHGATSVTAWTMIAGALVAAPLAPWLVRPPSQWAAVSSTAWWGVSYLVVGTSCVSYFFWSYGLRRLEASRVAVFSNLQPVETALLAWIITGERIDPGAVLGGGLVIAGVWLSQRTRSQLSKNRS